MYYRFATTFIAKPQFGTELFCTLVWQKIKHTVVGLILCKAKKKALYKICVKLKFTLADYMSFVKVD